MTLFDLVAEDLRCVSERDPAASSRAMVLLCYPGLQAVWGHRVHHRIWRRGFPLTARVLSQVARFCTGVEIHPGARLGRRLFIDHGAGVVIGETAVVGDDVTLYQGVTLGGTGKGVGKRHPTLRNGVYVGSNAAILGDITIGENSRVGAGSVVLRDVPPDSTVVGVPAHVVHQSGKHVLITDAKDFADPLSDVILALADQVEGLNRRVERLDGELRHAVRVEPAQTLTAEKQESVRSRELQMAQSQTMTMGEGI